MLSALDLGQELAEHSAQDMGDASPTQGRVAWVMKGWGHLWNRRTLWRKACTASVALAFPAHMAKESKPLPDGDAEELGSTAAKLTMGQVTTGTCNPPRFRRGQARRQGLQLLARLLKEWPPGAEHAE